MNAKHGSYISYDEQEMNIYNVHQIFVFMHKVDAAN